MTSRFHTRSLLGKSPPHITRLRIRMLAQALRNVGVAAFGLCAGWMAMTLSYNWSLALIAAVGVGAFLIGYWLIPFYAEPDGDL